MHWKTADISYEFFFLPSPIFWCRLTPRTERGKEKIRADAPTAAKDALKLALIIAANEGFKVKSGDIKSEFLQGAKVDGYFQT